LNNQQTAGSTIEEIASAVVSCTRCVLSETRTNAVPGDGSATASVLFIGEGPGQNEDEQGLPFIGRAGKLLDALMAEVPLLREDVFITNVVKCRPPGNRDPLPDEVAACLPYLKAQIELIDPRVIVTLGRHSMLRFYPEGKISNDHGRIIRIGSRILLPVYHPAAALRNPKLKETLQQDMLRIPEAVRESLLLQSEAAPSSEPASDSSPDVVPDKSAGGLSSKNESTDEPDTGSETQISLF
jgi:DNA polymerase